MRKKKLSFSKVLRKQQGEKKPTMTNGKSSGKLKETGKLIAGKMKKQTNKVKDSSQQFNNRKKRNVSIRIQLTVVFLLVTIIPVTVIGTTFSRVGKNSVDELIDMFTQQILQQSTKTMDTMIREIDNQSYMLLGDSEFSAFLKLSNEGIDNAYESLKNDEKINTRLQQVVFSVENIKGAAIYTLDQKKFYTNGQGFNNGFEDKFIEGGYVDEAVEASGRSVWIDDFLMDNGGEAYLVRRLMDMVTSKEIAVLVFTIDRNAFQQNISRRDYAEDEEAEMLAQCTYSIVNPEGTILLSSDGNLVGEELKNIDKIESMITEQGLIAGELNGFTTYRSYSQISNGWVLVSEMSKRAAMSSINKAMLLGYFAIFGFILISLILAYFVSTGVVKPINDLIKLMDIVKEGDLTARSPYSGKAEIGRLSISFNTMLERVGTLIGNTTGTIKSVESEAGKVNRIAKEANVASTQIATAVEAITLGSSQQAEEAEQATTALDEYVDKVKVADDSFSQVYEVTKSTKNISSNAMGSIHKLQSNTEMMLGMASTIESNVVELQTKSSEISNITQMINAIADQTNLLALNATIEAARAGDAGRGFAVVADEVRKLAEQSKEAAQLIDNLIKDMNNKTNLTVKTVKDSDHIYKEQEVAVEETSKVFVDIEKHMEGIMDKIQEMMRLGDSRNEAQGKVIDAITSMAAVAEENAASTEEVMASSEEQVAGAENLTTMSNNLIDVVEELNRQLEQFKF